MTRNHFDLRKTNVWQVLELNFSRNNTTGNRWRLLSLSIINRLKFSYSGFQGRSKRKMMRQRHFFYIYPYPRLKFKRFFMLVQSICYIIPPILLDAWLNLAIINCLTRVFIKGSINTPILTQASIQISIPNPLSLFFYLGFELFLQK